MREREGDIILSIGKVSPYKVVLLLQSDDLITKGACLPDRHTVLGGSCHERSWNVRCGGQTWLAYRRRSNSGAK